MGNVREHLLDLSSLASPDTALNHFLSIRTGECGGGIVVEVDRLEARVYDEAIKAKITETVVTAKLIEQTIKATILDRNDI